MRAEPKRRNGVDEYSSDVMTLSACAAVGQRRDLGGLRAQTRIVVSAYVLASSLGWELGDLLTDYMIHV
jgi:hypothetical protein